MHVSRIQISGNSLVGLYIIPLEDVVLVGLEVPDTTKKIIEEVFDAPIVQVSLAGTPLLGVFAASDGDKIVIPHIAFDHEKQALKEAGVDFEVVRSSLTCHGNNLVVTRQGLVANPEYELEAIETIERFFGHKAVPFDFEETPTVGSFIAHNTSHGLASHDFSESTLQKLSDILGLILATGTVNMGSPQIKSGVAVNDKGFLIGENSGGPEVINADDALGFTEQYEDDQDETDQE